MATRAKYTFRYLPSQVGQIGEFRIPVQGTTDLVGWEQTSHVGLKPTEFLFEILAEIAASARSKF